MLVSTRILPDVKTSGVTIVSLRKPSRVVPLGVAMQIWSPCAALADPTRKLVLPPSLAAELQRFTPPRSHGARARRPRRTRGWLHRMLAVLS